MRTALKPSSRRRSATRAVSLCMTVVAAAALPAFAGPGVAAAAPTPVDHLSHVPPRTAMAFHSTFTNTRVTTPNAHESRPGLSMVKIYIADYALRRGDRSAADLADGERMVRFSDNAAADRVSGKYPQAIDEVAREYGLTATRGAAHWGQARTSAVDLVDFIEAKKATDPLSPILAWMSHQDPAMADGTPQHYGTSHVPGSRGTKWGLSGYGPNVASSASFGVDFAVAAITYGTTGDHTADVVAAFHAQQPETPGNGAYPQRPQGLNFGDALVWEMRTFLEQVTR